MRIFTILIIIFSASFGSSQELSLELFVQGFSNPVDIVHAGDERLFVVEKRGLIKIIDGEANVLNTPFLDIDSRVGSVFNEQGLLGLAFHPDYANNGYFFVNYTNNSGNTVISRFEVSGNPNVADISSEKILMTVNQPFNNHNGGDIAFGPDGYLYIGLGDGGSANDPGDRSQDPMEPLGKMLRIDVDNGDPYAIPPDNPFADDDFTLDEIWSIGLRNPWRYSFDRETGDLWMGDVGQNRWEEICFQPADSEGGENYGWRCYEAEEQFNTSNCNLNDDFVFPVFFYSNNPNGPGCSVTGGYVYRGQDFPSLRGKYIFTDFCSGWFWTIENDGCGNWIIKEDLRGQQFQYSTFGEDHEGELYVAALGSGSIFRVRANCSLTVDAIVIDSQCPEENTGSITLEINAQSTPIITWDNGNTSEERTGLFAGEYSVTVTDNTGCEYQQCFQIRSITDQQTCESNNLEDTKICPGDDGILSACDAPEGYSFAWYKDGAIIEGAGDQDLTVTEAGDYQVQWVGPNCNYALSSVIVVEIFEVVTPQIDADGGTLTATEGFLLYNWYVDGELVGSGESNILFADQEGNYTVEGIDQNGCLSMLSDPVFVEANSLEDLAFQNVILLYPNPAYDIIKVDFDRESHIELIEIYNIQGQLYWSKHYDGGRTTETIDLNQWSKGIYFLKSSQKGRITLQKFLVL